MDFLSSVKNTYIYSDKHYIIFNEDKKYSVEELYTRIVPYIYRSKTEVKHSPAHEDNLMKFGPLLKRRTDPYLTRFKRKLDDNTKLMKLQILIT